MWSAGFSRHDLTKSSQTSPQRHRQQTPVVSGPLGYRIPGTSPAGHAASVGAMAAVKMIMMRRIRGSLPCYAVG